MFLIAVCFSVITAADEFIVVVNKNSTVTSVSTVELKRIYTGKLNEIGSSQVKPVNLALDNTTAVTFLKNITGMDVTD